MLKAKFYEVFEEEKIALLQFLSKDIECEFTHKTIQEEAEAGAPAGFISVRTQSIIPREWANKIDGILSRSQGYDHILMFKQETGSKAILGFIGDYCSRAVAEQAIMNMFVLFRQLKRQLRQFKEFSRDGLTGHEVKGKNALVVGVGNIGSEIVDASKGLGMNVRGVDIEHRLADLEYVELNEGLEWADVIFCALPHTEQTKNMLNYNVLSKSVKGGILVNVSRGEITPNNCIKKLLDEEVLAGVALDVFEDEQELAHFLRQGDNSVQESVTVIKDMVDRDNVVFTPHNAFNTTEALEKKARLSAEATEQFFTSKTFPFAVE